MIQQRATLAARPRQQAAALLQPRTTTAAPQRSTPCAAAQRVAGSGVATVAATAAERSNTEVFARISGGRGGGEFGYDAAGSRFCGLCACVRRLRSSSSCAAHAALFLNLPPLNAIHPLPPSLTPPQKNKGLAERPPDVAVVERAGWDADRDLGGVATLPKPDMDGAAGGAGGAGGGGHYRVLLLDAPAHTERRVVSGLTTVVPGVDEARARNVFETSRQLGVALVVSCLKEHAEHYRQQLYTRGLRTAIEPDTAVA